MRALPPGNERKGINLLRQGRVYNAGQAHLPPWEAPITARRSANPAPAPPPPAEPADSIQLEGLITTLATSFISLGASEVDSAICRSLGMLGEFAGAQRSYICLVSEDGSRIRHTHQWCTEGVEALDATGFATSEIPWGMGRLNNLEEILIPDLDLLPPEAEKERAFLESNKVRSALIVPLRYGPSMTGALGFESLRQARTWSEEWIALLKIAGVVFGSAIERKRSEEERSRLIFELQESLARVRTLSGMLPICASCKKIRDDKGYWNQIETYIRDRSEAEFTHGICPECAARLYPQDYKPK